ncbi:MAG: type III-B CRISPR-associated protein Cas10/Cmr2 [Verrucomicrobiales bacterium]|nr:type III-B CRISPR-associated protein Cas10/Cmr2 [Verrucomicrobiales bacterium]
MIDWKRKLAAYLHDPPSKALDIRTHGDRSDAAFRRAGFTNEAEIGEYFRHADYTGAAADRLPFPDSQAADLKCAFDGRRNSFLHPLNGEKLRFHAEFKSAEQSIEGEESVQPLIAAESLDALPDDDLCWRARFLAHWRLWPKHAMEKDYRLALLPADTRIPDHSIWTHMQVVSALDGCIGGNKVWQPAFLKLQLGPVQDFIAAARSIRDLWSGSYLLSWLMAAGLKALSAEIGPDAVIFPNLRGQPLFDLHWREDLWQKVKIGDQTVWESLGHEQDEENPRKTNHSRLLTPNLPNVFLAVAPADRAAGLCRRVADAIQAEWEDIARAVWDECEKAGLTADESNFSSAQRKTRFNAQVKRFLSLSWQVTPWPESLESAMKLAEGFAPEMPVLRARDRVQQIVQMAEKQMPFDHRDRRFYTDDTKTKLRNIGLGWSVILAHSSWQLDAVRQTRVFAAANPGGWQVGTFSNKDALTGRGEAVAGGLTWGSKARALSSGPWKSLFKKDDWLSAETLIKRVWHFAHLAMPLWDLKTDSYHFPMPNTRGIAGHRPEEDCGDDETAEDASPSERYFAVLALDGDEIGKWISGEKTPPFSSQLADYSDGSNTQRFGSKPYFEKPEFKEFLKARRPLSPSYHLQFSEALSNFALLCARPIVEAFDGRLIYAGGDDVVALLPADTALACAQALRSAFQGREVCASDDRILFRSPAPGFLNTERWKDDHGRGRPIPFLVPGPAADCSVGIAIAHFKAPLQDVVRAAQAAEKRAKRKPGAGGLDRKAVAVTLMKRSGEIIEWGCQWESGGLELARAIADAMKTVKLSGKFPHRVVELLEPYLLTRSGLYTMEKASNFDGPGVITREFAHALDRQTQVRGEQKGQLIEALAGLLDAYLKRLGESSRDPVQDLIGLCQTVAFAHRTGDDVSSSAPSVDNTSDERQLA